MDNTRGGFTLVELAVAIAVIGVIVGMAMGSYKLLISAKDDIKLNARLDKAVSEVVLFASSRGRLPTRDEFPQVVQDNEGFLYGPVDNLIALRYDGKENPLCGVKEEDSYNVAFLIDTDTFKRDMTVLDLKALLGCVIKENLKIFTSSLPAAFIGSDYRAVINVSGGEEDKHKWCAEPLFEREDEKRTWITSTKPYADNRIFSDNCSKSREWVKSPEAVISFSGYGVAGDGKKDDKIGAGAVPIRVYVTDGNFSDAVYRDFSLVSADTSI